MDPDDAGWEWAQDDEARRFLEEAQELLKADAEAYEAFLDEVFRQGLSEHYQWD